MEEAKWQAIVGNDASYDGKFYYGVVTTGIFCRPSCKSRVPSRDNVRLFESTAQAIRESFRPCKRCKPDGTRLPNEEWVEQIVALIKKRYAEPLTLDTLADLFHGSPYHLQRTFKRVTGVSPAAFIQTTRLEKAKELLERTDLPVNEVGSAVGFPNAAHFATSFQRYAGATPTAYRQALAIR